MINPQEFALNLDKVSLSMKGNTGQVEILKSIDLSIPNGQSVGIIGPSGSGKSSLLMLMAGLEYATAGTITCLGTDITGMDETEMARFRQSQIGVVFQSFHLIPTMTAQENITTPLELAGLPNAAAAAKSALDAVGLSDRGGHYPSQLSGGEQQRVAVARALAPKPLILFADEPTGNLDAASGQTVTDLLLGAHVDHGTTLILVTHATDLAQKCQRVVSLNAGQITADTGKE